MPTQPNDRDLEQRVVSELSRLHFPALRKLQVIGEGGKITLRGRVKSYYERQLCIRSCHKVRGIRDLHDQIEVSDT